MLPLNYERSSQDSMSSGESLAYYIRAISPFKKYLPRSVRFNYVGMYPVITDSTAVVDWRGNLAFNGTTLRADGIQSAWCPILYDVKNDKLYEKVTYELDVTCNDCKVIYVNGSQPITGTRAQMKSTNSQDLTMFAGDFRSVSINGNYFLNPDADDEQLAGLEKTLDSYQRYLEKKLAIPYKGKAVYIQTTPVSKNNSCIRTAMIPFPSSASNAFFKRFSITQSKSGGLIFALIIGATVSTPIVVLPVARLRI